MNEQRIRQRLSYQWFSQLAGMLGEKVLGELLA